MVPATNHDDGVGCDGVGCTAGDAEGGTAADGAGGDGLLSADDRALELMRTMLITAPLSLPLVRM